MYALVSSVLVVLYVLHQETTQQSDLAKDVVCHVKNALALYYEFPSCPFKTIFLPCQRPFHYTKSRPFVQQSVVAVFTFGRLRHAVMHGCTHIHDRVGFSSATGMRRDRAS